MARSSSSTLRMDASCGAGPAVSAAATSMAFNPDGSRLAFVSGFSGSVHVLATDSGRGARSARQSLRRSFTWPGTRVGRISWRPASRTTRSASGTWTHGRQTVTLEGDSYNGLVVAFHPGGELLASRGWSGVIRFWDIRTGRQLLSMPSGWLPELHFARDGSRLSAHCRVGSSRDPRSVAIRPNAARWSASRGRCRATPRRWRSTTADVIWPRPVRTGSRSGTCPRGRPWRYCR